MRRFICLLVAAGLLAGSAAAQTSTGRHRVDRSQEERPEVAGFDDAGRRWTFTAGAGVMAAGDLVRVRTAGASGIPWDPPGGEPFNSEAFTLTLDESILVSVGLGHRLSERVWIRATLGLAQLDVAAKARIGQTAEVRRWDQLSVMVAGIDAELRLHRSPSFFYLLGGASVVNLAGDAGDQLDGNEVALRGGAGSHLRLAPGWGLRLEARDNLAALDLSDLEVPVAGTVMPDLTAEDAGTDHVWELLVSMQTAF